MGLRPWKRSEAYKKNFRVEFRPSLLSWSWIWPSICWDFYKLIILFTFLIKYIEQNRKKWVIIFDLKDSQISLIHVYAELYSKKYIWRRKTWLHTKLFICLRSFGRLNCQFYIKCKAVGRVRVLPRWPDRFTVYLKMTIYSSKILWK